MSCSEGLDGATRAILVPVDFEAASRAALVFAARLAVRSGAPLTILHVVHEPANRPNYYRRHGGSEASLPMEVLAERRLDEFLSEVRGRNPDLGALATPGILMVTGLPETRIPELGARMGAAQIVMGHSRRRGLLDGVFASLSDRVADKSDIPVTVIRAGRDTDPRTRTSANRLNGRMAFGA